MKTINLILIILIASLYFISNRYDYSIKFVNSSDHTFSYPVRYDKWTGEAYIRFSDKNVKGSYIYQWINLNENEQIQWMIDSQKTILETKKFLEGAEKNKDK